MRRPVLALLLVAVVPLAARAQTISTVAGGGPNNLPALSSNLAPLSVARDGAGNLYISSGVSTEFVANRVYKVSSSGQLTVFAGNGTPEYSGDGGPATAAGLSDPYGISADGSGNVYIADGSNCLIRRVDAATGKISTVAGNTAGAGTLSNCGYGGDGGPATSALLDLPTGVYVDGSGNIFIADTSNNRIREVVASTGIIQTVAGNGTGGFGGDGGPATSAALDFPAGIFLDGSNNIFFTDSLNCLVRRVDASNGKITTVAGNTAGAGTGSLSNCAYLGDGGPATSAELSVPIGIFLDSSGNIFIADQYNHAIRKVTAATGKIQTVAGNGNKGFGGDGGPATAAMLLGPTGVAVDGSGDIFIADGGNLRIREVVASTGDIQTFAGNGTPGYSGDGSAATNASLYVPFGVAVDGSGNIYIPDSSNYRIREVVAATGNIQTVAGNGLAQSTGDGGLATNASLGPSGVSADSHGNLFATDTNRIREVVASTGIIQTVAGNGPLCLPSTSACGDGGPATAAQLALPAGVFVDGSGNIFIADTLDNRVREVVAASGNIQTVAGTGTQGFSGDGGSATSAELNVPNSV